MKANKWVKQSIGTHFAGIKPVKGDNSNLNKWITNAVLECLGDETICPLPNPDNYSDGVFHYRETGETFVKFLGVWYIYKSNMVMWYLKSLNVAEIDMKDRNAILAICKTKFATKEQQDLKYHICQLASIRRMQIESYPRLKLLRKKIAEIKDARKQSEN